MEKEEKRLFGRLIQIMVYIWDYYKGSIPNAVSGRLAIVCVIVKQVKWIWYCMIQGEEREALLSRTEFCFGDLTYASNGRCWMS